MKKGGSGLKTADCAHCGRTALLDSRPNLMCACGEPFVAATEKGVEASPVNPSRVVPPVSRAASSPSAPESDGPDRG